MGNDAPREIDTVNPYDPPERQALEGTLQGDERLQHQVHRTIESERQLAHAVEGAGIPDHAAADARIADLEQRERDQAGVVVHDQQNIDHWDQAHPGWDSSTGATADDSSDPYAGYDAGDGSGASAGAAADDGSGAADPYATADASATGGDDGSYQPDGI